MATKYPPDGLGFDIRAHWKEHRPKMYRELQRLGRLEQSIYEAQERTKDAFADLVSNQGVPAFMANEATRELWAFLPAEADEPELPDARNPLRPQPPRPAPAR